MKQAVECSYWTYVGKKSQFLTHSEQALLRTNLGCGVVVKTQVADSSKQHSISAHTYIMSCLRIRITNGINSMGSTESFLIRELVTEFSSDGIHHSNTLFHNLWTNSVARENGNFQFHIYFQFS